MSKREEFVITLLFVSILMIYIAKVVISAELVTDSNNYGALQDQLQQIKTQNEELKNAILQQEAYVTIEQKAKKMGFVKDKPLILQ